ncbi:MAG: PAS domain-containing protein [Verrucomicrobia bacterium]|nr:PAS domain-containing protein [Verrucomicrobiota bacterium]
MSPGEALSQIVEENVVLRSVLREQRKLQSALSHMNGRLRSFLATVPGVLYSFRPDGRLEYISPSVQGLLGQPDRFYLGDAGRYLDQVHPDDLGRVFHWRLQLIYARGPMASELRYRIVRPDDTVVEVLDRATAVFEDGELARVDGLIVVAAAHDAFPGERHTAAVAQA